MCSMLQKKSIIAFEYKGCYYHGHDCHLTKHMPRELLQQRQEEDRIRDEEVKNHPDVRHYYVQRECEWLETKSKLKLSGLLARYMKKFLPPAAKPKMTNSEMLEAILDGQVNGIVRCDLHCDEELKKKMRNFGGCFIARKEMRIDDLDSRQQKTARLLGRPEEQMVIRPAFSATGFVCTTTMLKFLLDSRNNVQCSNIIEVVEFSQSGTPLRPFIDKLWALRSAAAAAGDKLADDTIKSLANHAFGYSLSTGHSRLKICTAKEMRRWKLQDECVHWYPIGKQRITKKSIFHVSCCCFFRT